MVEKETSISFHKNNYLFVENVLDKDYCSYLISCMKESNLKNEYSVKHLYPKNEPNGWNYDTISKTPYFEKLLVEFQKDYEAWVDKKLYPTYSCSKIYAKDDMLCPHIDQDSCQYSATITLGFSHEPWEFCISDDGTTDNYTSFLMDVGDVVLYNGKILHWRKGQAPGDWHYQVFLHYVDANGPYSHWKYNGREKLNIEEI